MKQKNKNPFEVKIPNSIEAKEVITLFVPEVNHFNELILAENAFINGPRGSGKSMMFRYMMPDCQLLELGSLDKLEYFSIYIPIKKTEIDKVELGKLKDQASVLLNEQILVNYVALLCFETLSEIDWKESKEAIKSLEDFYNSEFKRRVKMVGGSINPPNIQSAKSLNEIFSIMRDFTEEIFNYAMDYCSRLSDEIFSVPTYDGPLCTYLNFLDPLITRLRELPFFPKAHFYFLVDDADNLNMIQTKILNSWVSFRSYPKVCFKISTQMQYKTRSTISGPTIDNIHDYHSINIATIYTTDTKDNYSKSVKEIVEKRLSFYKLEHDIDKFFPEYEKQEKRIKEIYNDYIKKFKQGDGKGSQINDDAYRYSRPDYIKELGGISKQRSNYYYAGFKQLVHLSSGIIRHFLDPAASMYSKMKDKLGDSENVLSITPAIQNDVVREYANGLLFTEFDDIVKDIETEGGNIDNIHKLKNLINALGGMFSAILLSDASERRVFSIALSDEPDKEVKEILKLGVKYGYFHESTRGNKEGTGRTRRYIMNRSLAPFFTLDPTSFAGDKFITSEGLKLAIHRPKSFVDNVKKKLRVDPDYEFPKQKQLSLFRD